jgi:hypothetical protein
MEAPPFENSWRMGWGLKSGCPSFYFATLLPKIHAVMINERRLKESKLFHRKV